MYGPVHVTWLRKFNCPPIAVLPFISIFCPVVKAVLAVFCPVGVRLLSASEFGTAPGIELIYVLKIVAP
jgi:hypothetical protein